MHPLLKSLSLKERIALTEDFKSYLTDKSRIVVTLCLAGDG